MQLHQEVRKHGQKNKFYTTKIILQGSIKGHMNISSYKAPFPKKSHEFLGNVDFEKESSPIYEEFAKTPSSGNIMNSSVNQVFIHGDKYRIFYDNPDVKYDEILM